MTRRRRLLWIPVLLLMVIVMFILGLNLLTARPNDLGLHEGRLRPCPDSPNCVCSFDSDEEHGIAPFAAGDDPQATMERLRTLLQSMPRAEIITDDGHYLHAEFTTPLLRFVDDVEFLLDEAAGVVHIRSASRVGRSDFGTNRQRIETLRTQLSAN